MKIPSNIYDCPVIVQAWFKNKFRDKIPGKQAFFLRLKDAHDFIIENSTISLGADNQYDFVAEVLGITQQDVDNYEQIVNRFLYDEEILRKYCADNEISRPCGVAVYFLADGESIGRAVGLTYLPDLKKFVNNKKIL